MKLIRISSLLALLCPFAWTQSTELHYNVIVKDKKGQPVKTLSADQIEMTDAGNRVDVTLRLYDGADLVEGGQRKPADPIRRIRLIPVVLEGMSNEQRRLAKQIALDLIKEDKEPGHLFAIFNFSNQHSLLQPFTTNRDALRKAIELATSGVGNQRFAEVHREVKAKLEALAANSQALTDADVAPAQLDSSPALQGLLARLQLSMLSSSVIDDGESTRRSITFLNSMVVGLKSFPGRKAIPYLVPGIVLPTNLDPLFEAMHARANDAGVSIYPIDCRGITVAAQTTNVANATTDNAGIVSGLENAERGDRTNGLANASEGLRGNVQSVMRVLADATGGVMAIESNDPRRQLRELISDTQTYYEVSYDPKISDYNGSFRKTSFKVKQGDYRVRDRDGYLAMPPGQENLLPYEIPLLKALNANPLVRDVEFRSGTWKLKSSKDKISAVVAVEVPFAALAFAQDATKAIYAAHISLVTQVRDPQGNVVEKFTRDLPLKGKLDQLEALKTSNFNFRERFSVPPGRYIVETAVIDQLSGKVGARKTSFLASAGASALALSSVTLVRRYQPAAKDLTPEDPFQFQGGRITPTLDTNLKAVKGQQMALFFTVYPDPASTDAPQAIVQYFKDGVVAGTANLALPAADAQGRIPYVLSSPMDGMPPGSYEVKVIIKQGAAAAAESVFLNIGA